MSGAYQESTARNQFGALTDEGIFLLAGTGRLLGTRGLLQRVNAGLRLLQEYRHCYFPKRRGEERQRRSQGPELGVARILDSGFPAKELRRNEKGEHCHKARARNLNQEFPDRNDDRERSEVR